MVGLGDVATSCWAPCALQPEHLQGVCYDNSVHPGWGKKGKRGCEESGRRRMEETGGDLSTLLQFSEQNALGDKSPL